VISDWLLGSGFRELKLNIMRDFRKFEIFGKGIMLVKKSESELSGFKNLQNFIHINKLITAISANN